MSRTPKDNCWNCGADGHHRDECESPQLPGAWVTKKQYRFKNNKPLPDHHYLQFENIANISYINNEINSLIDVGNHHKDALIEIDSICGFNTIIDAKKQIRDMAADITEFYKRRQEVVFHWKSYRYYITSFNLQEQILKGAVETVDDIQHTVWALETRINGRIKTLEELAEQKNVLFKNIQDFIVTWRQVEIQSLSEDERKEKTTSCTNFLQELAPFKHKYKKYCEEQIPGDFSYFEKVLTEIIDQIMGNLTDRLDSMVLRVQCLICMDHERDVHFQCGHGCCRFCYEKLMRCPICKGSLEMALHLYF